MGRPVFELQPRSVPLAQNPTTCCAGGVEGVGDPRARAVDRQTDLRGVMAGVLIALLVASLALPVGGDVVTGGVARRLVLPAEPDAAVDTPAPGAFLIAAVEVRPQTLAQWVWNHTLGGSRPLAAPGAHLEAAMSGPRQKSIDPTAINSWAAAVREIGPVLEVTGVQAKSTAERAGLQIGDAVVTINGLAPDFHTLDGNLALGTTSRLRVYRDGRVLDIDLKPTPPWPQASGGGATFRRRAITAAGAGSVGGQGHWRFGRARARPCVHRHAHRGRSDRPSPRGRDRRARTRRERRSCARLRREGDGIVEGRRSGVHDAAGRCRRRAAVCTVQRARRSACRRWTRRCSGSVSTEAPARPVTPERECRA